VRRTGPDFVIVAGPGDPGDGQAAATAFLPYPGGTAIDAAGRFYVSELWTGRIRVVMPDGTIQTYAGTGVIGFDGDGGPAAQAQLNIYVPLAGSNSLLTAHPWGEGMRNPHPDKWPRRDECARTNWGTPP